MGDGAWKDRRGMDGVVVTGIGAMATMAALAGSVGLGALPPGPSAAAAAVIAAAGTGVLLMVSVRRRRALKKMERDARDLLAVALPREGAGSTGTHGDAAPTPADLAGLRRALDDLGHRLEGQLKEVAKKTRNLEALIAAMDEPLIATDNDDRVLLCNASAEAILGAAAGGGALVGRPVSQVFTHAELLAMHAAAKAGEVRRSRVPLTTPLGKRVFQVSASPVPSAWGRGVFGAVVVLRDVTELDQSVQVKTEFVANASHELRTPVAAIRAAAETLGVAAREDPAMAERAAGMIVGHAGRLEELLRDLLDLTRLESLDAPLEIEPVDPAGVEADLRAIFAEACRERNLSLQFDLDDDLAPMRTDRKMLMLIVRNLVENAAKFAFEGTPIRVTATLVEAHGDPPTRGVARWEVADQGVGIPLNQQDRVFERFYQVDAARTGSLKRGTGLGLAIAKHAARTLGGRVGLKSVWQQGTTVFAEVPVEFGIDR